jgi:outer membrane protein assembly factor BamB
MYRKGEQDVVVALDAATGRTVWEYAYDAPFVVAGRDADIVKEYHLEKGTGPMSTPLIVGDSLFTAGASGKFYALNRKTGKVLWKHDLIGDLQGHVRQRGYTCSPIAYENTVILPVGAVGGSLIAFDQKDGSIVWRRHDFRHAYASPILIDVDGQEQLVTFMLDSVVSVDPHNGDLLWTHRTTDQGTNVSTPVWGEGNLLFVSASYGYGSHGLKLTRTGDKTSVREVWATPRVRLHFANAIRMGPVIYGSSGDFGPAFFTALDAETGRVLWQDRRLSRASFIAADGRFILVDEDGVLVLATPSAEGLTINSQVQLLEGNAWTVPTLVGTTLYVRDRKTIMALDLSQSARGPS